MYSYEYSEYAEAMRALGRTEREIERSIERQKSYIPWLEHNGVKADASKFKAADYNKLIGKPTTKRKKPVSDATVMRYVKIARERGLI